MTGLLSWELVVGHDLPAERVVLEDDGTVVRLVASPGGNDHPQLGWWRGSVDPSVVGAAVNSAGADWSSTALVPVPPAAGGWWASRPDGGTIALWAATDIAGSLSALLGACARAADEPEAAAELSATSVEGDREAVLLALRSIGRAALTLTFAHDRSAPRAAFMTDEAEVVGFLGARMELGAGTAVSGVVRGRPPGPGGMSLSGLATKPDGESAEVRVTVAVGPPAQW